MTPAAGNLSVAKRAYDALLGDDLDAFVACCAPDIELEYPGKGVLPYGGRFEGHAGVRRWADAHDDAEEILDFQMESMLPVEEFVVVVGRFQGKAKPTGRGWETHFVHLLTFAEGRIQRFEAFFDTAAAVLAHREA